jgi:zinc metalloprotease ZmpB
MHKWLTILLVTTLSQPTLAQKAWVAENGFKYPIDAKETVMLDIHPTTGIDTAAVKSLLSKYIPNLTIEGSGLRLEHLSRSPKALHYNFAQIFRDRKIFRGSVKINIRSDGRVLSIMDHTFTVPEDTDTDFPPHDAYHAGLAVHYNHRDNGLLNHYKLEETFFWDGEQMLPCIRLEVLEHTDRYYEMVLNSDVRVIYQNDLITYSSEPTDSLVTMWVFNPDPLTSAEQFYGIPYADQDDMDIPELNAERIPVQTMVSYEDGIFRMRNSAVRLVDFSAPTTGETISTENDLNFSRSEVGFEECNVLYHITWFRDYIRSLGFDELMNYAIQVDAHALNGADNSQFNSGMNPPSLAFGNGGVDDAEDADVIIHEYGHAIMHSAAPGTNVGTQRRALDEAIGDYFASSYSRFLNPFRWGDVFTWDGHNEFWAGRSTISNKHYPEDLDNNIYRDAPIWSATLMQIWGDIGREATDAIMMQAAYSFSQGMTMPQAAMLFLQADTLLFDGAHFTPIHTRMYERGLLPFEMNVNDPEQRTSRYRLLGSADFAGGFGPVIVSGPEPFTMELTDMLGRIILREDSRADRHAIAPEGLTAGVYLLSVRSAEGVVGFRVVRR